MQATRDERLDKRLGGIHGQRTDYWSELALLIVPGATDGRDVGCQRQLTVDDNAKIARGIRDGVQPLWTVHAPTGGRV